MSNSHLLELVQIISESASALDEVCKDANLAVPRLDEPFTPQSEAFRMSKEAAEASTKIAAAAFQLLATVLPPPIAMMGFISGHFQTAALRVCLEGNITEILREAGPQGLHVDDIAAKANLSNKALARILRFLATQHVYKELTPDVFTNTRLSSVMDTGKSVDDIQANPAAKHENTWGFPAILGHQFDEIPKSSAFLWEALSNPKANEMEGTAFNHAFSTDLPLWTWFESPGQEERLKRFGVGMKGIEALAPLGMLLETYEWSELPQDSVVVDVGGGVGVLPLTLAEKFDHLKFVVQDRPPVIEEAKKVWNTKLPEALESGRVQLEVHDFFTEQPVKNASVFLLKHILHDWSDTYCIKILKELRAAAQPNTKLLILDNVMRYTCPLPNGAKEGTIPGATPNEAPAPLLANYGMPNIMGYLADITMMTTFGEAQERTVKDFARLFETTGWRIAKVQPETMMTGNLLQPIIAVPV